MKKSLLALLFLVLLLQVPNTSFAADLIPQDTIALHIGSPLILSDNIMKALDSDNPDVVPIIHKERTLVPVRAISEHFGAVVSYDPILREALIELNGEMYYFPIDKNHYRIEKTGVAAKTVYYDTEALIIENRTMVPLRLISEDILGKTVGYDDKVITIGNGPVVLNQETVAALKTKIGQVLKITSMEELEKIIADITPEYPDDKFIGLEPSPSLEAPSEAPAIPTEKADRSNDFSSTNEQVEGVNESDIVKTDGRFIYVALGKIVKIYDSNNGNPILTDEITLDVDKTTGQYVVLSELYIAEGRLVILGSRNGFDNWIRPIPKPTLDAPDALIMPRYPNKSFTYLAVYDIDNNGKKSLIKEFEIEGSLLSSRKKDDTLYLVVNKYLNYYIMDGNVEIPTYKDSTLSNEYRTLPLDRIMYHPGRPAQNYLIVAAIDIRNETIPSSINAFLGSGNLVYMSNEALYVAANDYSSFFGSITNIAKFNVDGLKVGFAGGGMVDGSILNQFSMDEFDGNLRVATTNWQMESSNALYILDTNLNPIGKVAHLAPGERIFSVRFMGDKGYIVTFRQVDPLFVFDLSDPNAPKVIGELKVPGFSNYLHPINENVLLGIGQNVDEITGIQSGIKLSTFDVSDGGKPREIANLVLGDSGSYAEVLNNHKALMLNPTRDMIAFDATLRKEISGYQSTYFYGSMILEVSKTGEIEFLKQISTDGIHGSFVRRILYIDNVFYYILDENIKTYDMDTFEEIT
ncbi:MAG: beta-propeller domain-containing protein [Clostridia bacterium]|nr:beta-propeller domain-containing protein [Clostridia bacterium]